MLSIASLWRELTSKPKAPVLRQSMTRAEAVDRIADALWGKENQLPTTYRKDSDGHSQADGNRPRA